MDIGAVLGKRVPLLIVIPFPLLYMGMCPRIPPHIGLPSQSRVIQATTSTEIARQYVRAMAIGTVLGKRVPLLIVIPFPLLYMGMCPRIPPHIGLP
ncbi:hypothetical protein DPMN_107792 [Dreissena polymorpha]|uniref:Uncharacterized protein n=1 Tax=Dreissena polymorpha TaxID=45954 RepID=A0A9D4QLA1_DREPO|nr:hypothetical protein DPMN_107792 [Dreissena polymorpha]